MPDGALAAGPRTQASSPPARARCASPTARRRGWIACVADATGLSRSYVQKLISDGRLTADGLAAQVERHRRSRGPSSSSTSRRSSPLELAPAPEIPVDVVYEDDDLLIVDKPSGLVVHPSPGHAADTLVNALLARADGSEYGGHRRGGAARASSTGSTATRAAC